MKKRLLTLIVLVLISTLVFSACGGSEDLNATPTKRGDAFQDDPTEVPVEDDEGETEEVEVEATEPEELDGVALD